MLPRWPKWRCQLPAAQQTGPGDLRYDVTQCTKRALNAENIGNYTFQSFGPTISPLTCSFPYLAGIPP